MATKRESIKPTPHGGVKLVSYFSDKDGNPVDEKDAKKIEAIEYDKHGKEIFRTYLEKR